MGLLTSGFHSWTEDLDSTCIESRIYLHPCRELWHCMSSIFNRDGVHSVEGRDVGDRICSIAVILDMNLSLWSWIWNNLDGQLCLACFRAVHCEWRRFVDLSSLQPWSASSDLAGVKDRLHHGFEWRTRDVSISKQDVDGILSRLSGQIRHRARSVSIVLALNLGFTRTLHSQPETPCTCTFGVDGKWSGFTHNTSLQARAVGSYLEVK